MGLLRHVAVRAFSTTYRQLLRDKSRWIVVRFIRAGGLADQILGRPVGNPPRKRSMSYRRTTSPDSRHPAKPARRDSGVSFIEILVSVVLLGTASIAILTAMAATVRSTSLHDQVASAQAQLADAGDILSDVTYAGGDPHYVECATPADYTAKLTTDWPIQANSWPDVVVADVDFWSGSGWGVGCVSGDHQMQRITLRADVDGHTRQLTVVKRMATEASGPGGAWNDGMVTPNPNGGF